MATKDQFGATKQVAALTPNPKPDPQAVEDFHTNDDIDARPESHHHTLGSSPSQAAPGNHTHDGSDSPLLLSGLTITGSRGGNTSLVSIIAALVRLGAQDTSTP